MLFFGRITKSAVTEKNSAIIPRNWPFAIYDICSWVQMLIIVNVCGGSVHKCIQYIVNIALKHPIKIIKINIKRNHYLSEHFKSSKEIEKNLHNPL